MSTLAVDLASVPSALVGRAARRGRGGERRGHLLRAPAAALRHLAHRCPAALFQAAEQAGGCRIVQFSALGSDADAVSDYHRSKPAADQLLRALTVSALIVQPTLVSTQQGASTRLFHRAAALPLLPLPLYRPGCSLSIWTT
jgi:uncharacterized protein YbjT (DUF2867 family)